MHGWVTAHQQVHPVAIIGDTFATDMRIFVARRDEFDFLRVHGYTNVHAIGLPIVYVKQLPFERRPDSLLVMPIHSNAAAKASWTPTKYAQEIERIREQFREVVVCVNGDSLEGKEVAAAFQGIGVPCVAGARAGDRNALRRMHVLLSSFEYVTTNSFGSHLAYAAYMGAKPSIYGTYVQWSEKDWVNCPLAIRHPEALNPSLDAVGEAAMRKHFGFLFRNPGEAEDRLEWGRQQVGHDNRVTPREMRRLFGWRLSDRVRRRLSGIDPKWPVRALVPVAVRHRYRLATDSYYRDWMNLRKTQPATACSTSVLGRKLRLRDAPTFLQQHEQLFRRKILEFLPSNGAPLIVDADPGDGLAAVCLKKAFPDCRMILLPPDADSHELLASNCASFGLQDVVIETPFLQGDANQGEAPSEEIEVDGPAKFATKTTSARLDDIITSEPVELLKLAIRADDLSLLEACAAGLRNVHYVLIRYCSVLAQGQGLGRTVSLLEDAGFRVHVDAVVASRKPFIVRDAVDDCENALDIFGWR